MFHKKKRLDDNASCYTCKGKMKANDDNNDILPRIISGYEDEITCPMYVFFTFVQHSEKIIMFWGYNRCCDF